jgi:hypothetical protein
MNEDDVKRLIAEALKPLMEQLAALASTSAPAAQQTAPEAPKSQAEKMADAQAVINQAEAESRLINELTDVVAALKIDVQAVGDFNPLVEYETAATGLSNTEDKLKKALQQYLIAYAFNYQSDKKPLEVLEAEINAMALDVLRDRYKTAKTDVSNFKNASMVKGVTGAAAQAAEADAMAKWITGTGE